MLDSLGDELASPHPCLVLLGDGELHEVILTLDGHQDVHFGGLGGNDLSVDAILGEVELDAYERVSGWKKSNNECKERHERIEGGEKIKKITRGLVNRDVGSRASDLNLDGGAVHDLNTRDGALQNDGCASAVVNSHGVNLMKD